MSVMTKIHQEQLRDMVVLRSGNQVISGIKTFAGAMALESGLTTSGIISVKKPISGEYLGGNLIAYVSGHESGSLDGRVTRYTTNAYGVGSNLWLTGSIESGHVEIVGSGGITCIINQAQRLNQLVIGLDASGHDLTFNAFHPLTNAIFSGQIGLTGSQRTSGAWLDYGTPLQWCSGGIQPLKANQGYFQSDLYDGSLSIRAGSKVGTDRSMQFFVYQEETGGTGQFEFLISTSGSKNNNQHFTVRSVSGLDPSQDCPEDTTAAAQLIMDFTPFTGNIYDEITITGATGIDFYGQFKIVKSYEIVSTLPYRGTNISGYAIVPSGTNPATIPTPGDGYGTLWISGIDTLCLKDAGGNVKQFATAS